MTDVEKPPATGHGFSTLDAVAEQIEVLAGELEPSEASNTIYACASMLRGLNAKHFSPATGDVEKMIERLEWERASHLELEAAAMLRSLAAKLERAENEILGWVEK